MYQPGRPFSLPTFSGFSKSVLLQQKVNPGLNDRAPPRRMKTWKHLTWWQVTPWSSGRGSLHTLSREEWVLLWFFVSWFLDSWLLFRLVPSKMKPKVANQHDANGALVIARKFQRIATYLATSQTYHHHTPWGPKYKERSSCIVVSEKDCWNLASSCWVMLWILRYLIQQMLFLFQIEFHDILLRSTKYIILHVWKPKRFKKL